MVKRALDLIIALAGLLLLAPLLLVVALVVKLTSAGPILYRGERVGRHGKPFRMLKFRTMVVDADQIGPALTRGGDTRITPVGRALRHWKLDEVPQLVNVLRGEMSVVGPRPEVPPYVALYTPEQRRVLEVRPGITGPCQVLYRHEEALLSHCADAEREYVEKIMPYKLSIDLAYVDEQSLLLDLKVIGQTLLCLFTTTQ